jgi:hypothetical protein
VLTRQPPVVQDRLYDQANLMPLARPQTEVMVAFNDHYL